MPVFPVTAMQKKNHVFNLRTISKKKVLKSDFVVAALKLNYYNLNSSEDGF